MLSLIRQLGLLSLHTFILHPVAGRLKNAEAGPSLPTASCYGADMFNGPRLAIVLILGSRSRRPAKGRGIWELRITSVSDSDFEAMRSHQDLGNDDDEGLTRGLKVAHR